MCTWPKVTINVGFKFNVTMNSHKSSRVSAIAHNACGQVHRVVINAEGHLGIAHNACVQVHREKSSMPRATYESPITHAVRCTASRQWRGPPGDVVFYQPDSFVQKEQLHSTMKRLHSIWKSGFAGNWKLVLHRLFRSIRELYRLDRYI